MRVPSPSPREYERREPERSAFKPLRTFTKRRLKKLNTHSKGKASGFARYALPVGLFAKNADTTYRRHQSGRRPTSTSLTLRRLRTLIAHASSAADGHHDQINIRS
jgi:hypothetical protein